VSALRDIAPDALRLIVHFEGCHKKVGPDQFAPYLCPAGVATIGIGSIYRRDGSRVQMTDAPISETEAFELLAIELAQKCLPAVAKLITVPLHPLSHGALVSFVYNAGAGALKASGLRRMINAKRWDDVSAEFAKWRIGGGRVLPGLVRRRSAESALFMRGVWAVRSGARAPVASSWSTEVRRAA
jgi:lysozyme